MKQEREEKRVGFWYSKQEPDLPKPVAKKQPFKDQDDFLEALKKVEGRKTVGKRHYRGWSTCRICKCKNGSTEFYCDGWVWPEGYKHYISEHNVVPDKAFYQFIMEKAGMGKGAVRKPKSIWCTFDKHPSGGKPRVNASASKTKGEEYVRLRELKKAQEEVKQLKKANRELKRNLARAKKAIRPYALANPD